MKGQVVLLQKRGIRWAFGFLAAMLLLGSLFDYPISTLLYDPENKFGLFFAAYGEYPAMLGFVAAGTLLWAGRDPSRKLIAALQGLGGTLLLFFGTLMAMMMPSLYLSLPSSILMGTGLLCSAAVVAITLRLCKNAERTMMLRVAAVLFFAIFAEMLLVNLIKIPWGRARMRLVATDPRAYFMPWWQAGSGLKTTLTAAGVAAEEFKSFPSGHTANAAILMLLGIFASLSEKLSEKKRLLTGIGFGWACLVAVSRIIMGAHYLTDTTVGFAVSLLVMLLVCKAIFRAQEKQPHQNNLQERNDPENEKSRQSV